jgi:glucose/arabinose dehydrogenase
MIKRTVVLGLLAVGFLNAPGLAQQTQGSRGEGVPEFTVRPGYRVTLASEKFGEARFMEFGDQGILYLSQPGAGTIQALRDKDGDGFFETSTPFVTDKPSVHAMQFKDGWLWFTQSETGQVHKARDTNGDGKADEVISVFPDGAIPKGGGHPFRGILIGDDAIYITVSDPTNMTRELDSDRKKIYRYNLDGTNRQEFCSGIRNTEKLQFRPGTAEIWGCDHGSDNFGQLYGEGRGRQPITDLNPPEELNHYVQGGFYGHPYFGGNRVPRPEHKDRPDIIDLASKTIPPAVSLGAHWAPNGFTFLKKEYFPDHQGDMFIAFHGSWNSSVRSGYCVQRVLFDDVTGKPYGQLTVVSTLSPDRSKVLGRPVDCTEAPDGSVLFTCSATKRVYRISKE